MPRTETIIDEEVSLLPFKKIAWSFNVYEGDRIKGLVQEIDSNWLRIYLFDEENYSKKLNWDSYRSSGVKNQPSYAINIQVDLDDTYYLLIEHADWWMQEEIVLVKVRRYRADDQPLLLEGW